MTILCTLIAYAQAGFLLTNGVKQGGAGCHMGKVFAGAFAYADDIILLSPSVQALNTLLFICNDCSMHLGMM